MKLKTGDVIFYIHDMPSGKKEWAIYKILGVEPTDVEDLYDMELLLTNGNFKDTDQLFEKELDHHLPEHTLIKLDKDVDPYGQITQYII